MPTDIDQRTSSSPSLSVFTRSVADIRPIVTNRPGPLPPPVWAQGPFLLGRDGKPAGADPTSVITPQGVQATASTEGAKPGRQDFAFSQATMMSLMTKVPGMTAPPEVNAGSGA